VRLRDPRFSIPDRSGHLFREGKGPRAIRVGNTLRYRRSEVERWLDSIEPTAPLPKIIGYRAPTSL